MVEYGRAFAAIRKDPKWMQKILVGALVASVPYIGMVWMYGWQLEYQRSVAWGEDEHLPGWSSFSGQAMQGLRAYVAMLPYSCVLSVVMMPLMLAVPLVVSLSASSDTSSTPLVTVLGIAAVVVMTLGFTVLIIPLNSAVTLRVALYQTLGSGFELREIWRLMKVGKRDFLRAWGFAAINIALSLAAMVAYFGVAYWVMNLVLGGTQQNVGIVIAMGAASYLGYAVVGTSLGLYLGLANMHYFGSYGRAVYGLAEVDAPPPAPTPSESAAHAGVGQPES